MCALIWLPSPRRKRPSRERLEVVADVGERHRVARERDRDAGAELEALGVLGGDHERQERVVVRLGRQRAVVADVLELLRHPRDLRRSGARDAAVLRPPSTARWRRRRSRPPDRIRLAGVTPQRYRPSMGRALPSSLSPSSDLVVQGVPARVPVLLPRPPARAAVAVGVEGLARAPGARAADVPARADDRTVDAALADLDRARVELADAPRVRGASSSATTSGRCSTSTPRSSCAATSSWRTRRPSTRSASS